MFSVKHVNGEGQKVLKAFGFWSAILSFSMDFCEYFQGAFSWGLLGTTEYDYSPASTGLNVTDVCTHLPRPPK